MLSHNRQQRRGHKNLPNGAPCPRPPPDLACHFPPERSRLPDTNKRKRNKKQTRPAASEERFLLSFGALLPRTIILYFGASSQKQGVGRLDYLAVALFLGVVPALVVLLFAPAFTAAAAASSTAPSESATPMSPITTATIRTFWKLFTSISTSPKHCVLRRKLALRTKGYRGLLLWECEETGVSEKQTGT